jgi:PqqD family protein of HPr-rel-A system
VAAASAIAAAAFALNAATRLKWRHWDGQWVVYDVGSGQTHQFDALSAAVLGLIESGPHTRERLIETLAQQLETSALAVLSAAVDTILVQLDTLSLIEPCQSCG